MSAFTIPSRLSERCKPRIADDALTFSVLSLDAYLHQEPRQRSCRIHQSILDAWTRAGLSSEADLLEWIREKLFQGHGGSASSRASRRLDTARKKAEQRRREGIRVLLAPSGIPRESGSAGACPGVLFATGYSDIESPLAAVFNSRKPRLVLPQDRWLAVLRRALHDIHTQQAGFASSLGTLTYDLVTAYAVQHSCPLLLVSLQPISRAPSPHSIVSCMTAARRFFSKSAMVCRDRLIAALSDLHCLIEIRSKGNLLTALERQQAASPRPQWIFAPERRDAQVEGNFQLLEKFPQWATPVAEKHLEIAPARICCSELSIEPHSTRTEGIVWSDYLYHYTRSLPGPWPAQEREEYLLQLIEGSPLAGHSALDSLIRILLEGRIRASLRLVRGSQPVISWTRRHPLELNRIRRWNRALIRWTFEPYGVGVKRSFLRHRGARPVIYAPDSAYTLLKEHQRFRFQKHEPPRCSWKAEREWRLAGDLSLRELAPEDGFVLVPESADKERIRRHILQPLPIIVLPRGCAPRS